MNSNACDHNPPTSQTDGQTTYHGNTALCYASHGKNEHRLADNAQCICEQQRQHGNSFWDISELYKRDCSAELATYAVSFISLCYQPHWALRAVYQIYHHKWGREHSLRPRPDLSTVQCTPTLTILWVSLVKEEGESLTFQCFDSVIERQAIYDL